jgi:serine/threonine protein kinase
MPKNDPILAPDQILDGYQLIRFLGRGGFGEVWLCRSEATVTYHALKFISGSDADLIEKEHHSLGLYRSAAARLRSPHLVPIEHINRHAAGLYYVMPLADGITDVDPADPDWQPQSLTSRFEAQVSATAWFSSQDIIALIHPLLDALQSLSDAGLVHRDVKPDNILFFSGSPCLGDISLLGEDAAVITRRGTPGYATPSWYHGGLPDMYGAAATLYTLLTGNPPDKMGRAAFLWPPQGEQSLPESERAEWKRLHAVIRRATEEKVGERFVDFRTMAAAVAAAGSTAPPALPAPPPPLPPQPAPEKRSPIAWVVAGVFFMFLGFGAKALFSPTPANTPDLPPNNSKPSPPIKPPEAPPAATVTAASTLSVAYDDAQLAYNSLTWIQNDLPWLNVSSEQHNLFQSTLAAIQSHTWSREAFEPALALQKLDLCLDAIPKVREIPNVQLAQLLLLQATGDPSAKQQAIVNPAFTIPGTDNLSYRVQLLSRLDAAEKAESLLDQVLENPSLTSKKRSDALIQRAEVRAKLGKFPEARGDASLAHEIAGQDSALKAGVKMRILRLESDHPSYAAYLKANPGK